MSETGPLGDQLWARGPLDALAHAQAHFVVNRDLDRRHALVAFDQALEAVVTTYLHIGPGREDNAASALKARERMATFWPKAKYVMRLAKRRGRPFPVSSDDVDLVHSLRNELQHGGGWKVPPQTLVEAARDAALAAFAALGVGSGEMITGSAEVTLQAPRNPDASYVPTAPISRGDRRPLVLAAYALAGEMDPDAEGLHVRHLAERLLERGVTIRGNPARTLYDALNHAHLNFDHLPPAIFRWKELGRRDPAQGIRGATLADAAYAYAVVNDPERYGLRLATEVMIGLRGWNVPIRGTDIGATLNEAVRRDPRFERVSVGTYRWIPASRLPGSSSSSSEGE